MQCQRPEITVCYHFDHGQLPFDCITLDVADENRAIFKYQGDDWKTPPPSMLEGLSLILSNEDHESASSNSTQKDEASPLVSYSESDLFYRNMPAIIVQVRGGLIDCEVPALQMDVANREISVDWRTLYTTYFSQRLTGIAQKEIVSVCQTATKAAVFVSLN